MEKLTQPQQPMAIIDYAHTPDALQKVLVAVRQHCAGKLWCVFGCGGDRDRGKRAVMGQIAQQFADAVVLTDDNPRHEASEAIITDISVGCPNPTAIIPQREQAILYALAAAKAEDAVVIAGKGHEDYQEVGGQRFPFSDKAVVEKWLAQFQTDGYV
jgi:UDP-N-acetylmuramoyl-L-alanyl-D-glutamate--2,6-diaminopimelate ligase